MLDISPIVIGVFKYYLILFGLAFFIYKGSKRDIFEKIRNKLEKITGLKLGEKSKENRWEEIYGDLTYYSSVQSSIVTITIGFIFFYLIIDICAYLFFSTSIIQILIPELSELSDDIIGILLSSIITVSVAFVGIIGIIASILYGELYVYYSQKKKIDERTKIGKQGIVWVCVSSYFIAFVILVFIQPLMSHLGS